MDFICAELSEEFGEFNGKKLLIIGGAGFLGYYLIQALLHRNEKTESEKAVAVTVYDNFIRGVPEWLTALECNPNLNLIRHDITHPLPDDIAKIEINGGT